jgi:argininosuccinate lyase
VELARRRQFVEKGLSDDGEHCYELLLRELLARGGHELNEYVADFLKNPYLHPLNEDVHFVAEEELKGQRAEAEKLLPPGRSRLVEDAVLGSKQIVQKNRKRIRYFMKRKLQAEEKINGRQVEELRPFANNYFIAEIFEKFRILRF